MQVRSTKNLFKFKQFVFKFLVPLVLSIDGLNILDISDFSVVHRFKLCLVFFNLFTKDPPFVLYVSDTIFNLLSVLTSPLVNVLFQLFIVGIQWPKRLFFVSARWPSE